MWEDLTIVLSCLGFFAAVAVLVAELPAVFEQMRTWAARRRGSNHPS
jgi:hypothetical protein